MRAFLSAMKKRVFQRKTLSRGELKDYMWKPSHAHEDYGAPII